MLFAYLGIASVLFMRVVASAYSSGTPAAFYEDGPVKPSSSDDAGGD
jgi:hypothetical protein